MAYYKKRKEKPCPSNKIRHETEEYALRFLGMYTKLRESGLSKYKQVRCYKCPICSGYHLTSRP